MAEQPSGVRRVTLFDSPDSSEAYQTRDLLTRSVVGFDWIELASDEDCARELGLLELANIRLPDGRRLFVCIGGAPNTD